MEENEWEEKKNHFDRILVLQWLFHYHPQQQQAEGEDEEEEEAKLHYHYHDDLKEDEDDLADQVRVRA